MATTLMTAWEVIKYSPLSDKYPPGDVEPHIFRTEQSFKRVTFGTFYDTLKADLVDYGKLNDWDTTATYALNDYVIYYGTVLQSLTASNTVDPCEDDGAAWQQAKKFNTDCYNNLWTDGSLRDYLAFVIAQKSNAYTTYQLNAKGTTTHFSDETGTKTATRGEYGHIRGQLSVDIDESYENLICYMEDNCDTCTAFSTAKVMQKYCNNVKQPRRGRRFLF